tara:strand:- start:369 stop:563 length:195 start_codon:yes stop_codon:yes gene_type:complete
MGLNCLGLLHGVHGLADLQVGDEALEETDITVFGQRGQFGSPRINLTLLYPTIAAISASDVYFS